VTRVLRPLLVLQEIGVTRDALVDLADLEVPVQQVSRGTEDCLGLRELANLDQLEMPESVVLTEHQV